jgi:hypothetical protein
MRLEAFHLLATLHHIYAIVHLLSVNYVGATDAYILAMKNLGFRYLTTWNLVSEQLYVYYGDEPADDVYLSRTRHVLTIPVYWKPSLRRLDSCLRRRASVCPVGPNRTT